MLAVELRVNALTFVRRKNWKLFVRSKKPPQFTRITSVSFKLSDDGDEFEWHGVSNLACRTSRQRLSFDMRGPIRINLDKIEGTCGCAVIDLLFPAPICVGELVFYNYYTAWVTILVPSQPPQTQEDQHNSSKITMEPNQNTTSDIDKKSSQGAIPRSSSKQKELGGWTVSIRKHLLMKHPHYEEGSQDFVSIPATKSEVKWDNLVAMRLLLFQPSPYWQTFHIEQINLYREVPPPVPEPILNILGVIQELDLNRQNNSLLSLMHFQTQASLDRNHCTDKDDTEPVTGNSYEFTNLPKT